MLFMKQFSLAFSSGTLMFLRLSSLLRKKVKLCLTVCGNNNRVTIFGKNVGPKIEATGE
jgi:hypothetical protein